MESHDPMETASPQWAYHEAYVQGTGQNVNFLVQRCIYDQLIQYGYTPDDVKTVVAHVKAQNQRAQYKRSLRISMLLGDISRFDETLAEARAIERSRIKKTAKDRVLREWRGVDEPESAATSRCVSLKDALLRAIEPNEKQGIA